MVETASASPLIGRIARNSLMLAMFIVRGGGEEEEEEGTSVLIESLVNGSYVRRICLQGRDDLGEISCSFPEQHLHAAPDSIIPRQP